MSSCSRFAWDDSILPFQLDRSGIRGRVTRLDGVLDTILAKRGYPHEAEVLMAEACLLTALIGQVIKRHWKLSLQIRGNGPIRLIATDYFGPQEDGRGARIRAYASCDDGIRGRDKAPFELIGEGYFAILVDQGSGTVPYQAVTPLEGDSLTACAETHFDQSEQLLTRFALSARHPGEPGAGGHWRAGGVMLQQMPKASPSVSDIPDRDEREGWARTNHLLDTAEADEIIGPEVQPTDLLLRLFHEERPRVFDAQPIRFGCTCSDEHVRRSLVTFSAEDIAEMTTDDGIITADCQYCGAHYEFDPDTLGGRLGGARGDADRTNRRS